MAAWATYVRTVRAKITPAAKTKGSLHSSPLSHLLRNQLAGPGQEGKQEQQNGMPINQQAKQERSLEVSHWNDAVLFNTHTISAEFLSLWSSPGQRLEQFW